MNADPYADTPSSDRGMWEPVVRALAGRWARLEVRGRPPNGWGDGVFARVSILGGLGGQHAVVGTDREDALRLLAVGLAQDRLTPLLRRAGWTIMEVADDAAYVVARDPGNALLAIGVAAKDDDKERDWLRRSMPAEQQDGQGRTVSPVIVEPFDARDSATLVAAIESSIRSDTAPGDIGGH